ncbi:hypothetical protein [Streptomyces sp. NPDC059466]
MRGCSISERVGDDFCADRRSHMINNFCWGLYLARQARATVATFD